MPLFMKVAAIANIPYLPWRTRARTVMASLGTL